ncbi:MAG: RNA polymerase sigma factor [Polyangiaceae bacterium]
MASSTHREPKLRLVPSDPEVVQPQPPAPPALDDSELLLALRAGDATAATALHDRVRPQVDRTVRRLLGPGDSDREDVTQLAMIELVTTIDRYRADCSLDTWTSTIAARVVYKHIRRRKTERRIFSALDADLLAASRSASRPGREAALRGATRRVLEHLDAMDESKAWAFVLHDVYGYDLREIAEITDVSVTAAQTRLVRGRREIHERIAGDTDLAQTLESTQGEP